MAEIFDIFKGKESDVKKTFEKKGYDWEKVKVRLEQIEIEKKLDELGNNFENLEANSEAHIQALEDLLGDLEQFKAEKGIIESVKNTAEEKAEKIKNKALEKASEEGKNFIEKYIPGAGKIMDFFEKVSLKISFAFDKFGDISEKKGFFSAIGVFFGIISGKIGLDYFEKKDNKNQTKNTGNINLTNTNFMSINDENKIDIQKNNGIDYHYKTGVSLLVSLSGNQLKNNIASSKIYDGLEGITYKEFLLKKNEGDFKDKVLAKNRNDTKIAEQYKEISTALSTSNVQDLLRIGLSNKIMTNIFQNNKKYLERKFGIERYSEILKMLNNNSFEYEILTIKELSILYLKTIPALGSLKMISTRKEFKGYTSSVKGFFGDIVNENQGGKNIFSDNLLKSLLLNSGKGENMNKNEVDMIKELKLTDTKDIADFKKIYEFKKYLYGMKFLTNKKIGFNTEQRELFQEKMNYKSVLVLYITMGGNEIENLNSVNIPILIYTISKILSFGNNPGDYMTSSNYLKEYAKKIFLSDEQIFTENEKRVFEIYKDKIMDLVIYKHMSWFYKYLGLVTDNKQMGNIALGAGIGGLTLRHLSQKGIKKSLQKGKLPFFSKFANRLGWLGIGTGIVLGGLSIVSKSGDLDLFDKELEKNYNNGDVNGLLKVLDNHKNGIETYKRKEKGGEKNVEIIHYKDSSPYLKYNGKFYLISIMDKTKDAKYGLLNYLKHNWNPISENAPSINGKDISKISVVDKKIIFGEKDSKNEISVEKLLSGKWEIRKMNLDFQANLNSWVKYFDKDKKSVFGEGKTMDFIDTSHSIDNRFIVALIPLEISE